MRAPGKTVTRAKYDALAEQLRELGAYQEAFFCIRKGMAPVKLSSGEGDEEQTCELLGAVRASGGVVIFGSSVHWANDWLHAVREHPSYITRDLADKIHREQVKAATRAA